VYVTTQEGLWGSTEETFLFYKKFEELLPGKEVVISKDQEDKLKEVYEKVLLVIHRNSYKITILIIFVISRCRSGQNLIIFHLQSGGIMELSRL
jgi:tyrosine-protein phosphatase YwqE